ncbi:hypothetical protein [Inquilinus sp.]|uniref:hypothetical protein n=1 Tax=Inquilinus sp. TaxID=1932117 RepID=UPI003783388C
MSLRPILSRRRAPAWLLLAALALPGLAGLASPAVAQGTATIQGAPAAPGTTAIPGTAAVPPPFDPARLVPQTGPVFRQAETLGRQIYVLDGAVALASDLLRRQGVDLRASGVSGWVTEPVAAGILVRFVRRGSAGPEALYDVTVTATGAPPTLARRDGAPLTPDQAAQFAAEQLALGKIDQPCSKTYNPIAFRDPGTRNWRVYALAAPAGPGVFLIGGHYRFLVSPDGGRILSGGRLSPPSCLAGQATAEGQRAVGFAVMEAQPAPTETQVFLSLLHQLPLIVMTPPDGKRWLVAGGSIWSMR